MAEINFYLLLRFRRVPQGSDSEEREARQLIAEISAGPTERQCEMAKTTLLLAHDPLVKGIVRRFSACSGLPEAELPEAGRQGLFSAVESFHCVGDVAPPPRCRRLDFRGYGTWCVRGSIIRRVSQSE